MTENRGERLTDEEIQNCHSMIEEVIRVQMKKTGETAEQVVQEMDELSDINNDPKQKLVHQKTLRHIQEEDRPQERPSQVKE